MSDANDRVATLLFDAMKITEAIRFWEHEDRFVGFEDCGTGGRSAKVADQALVAVLRGVGGSWKMPLAYYLVKNTAQQTRFPAMVMECLSAACNVGVDVRVFTCDQERSQWAWLQTKGVSVEHPYFLHPITNRPMYVVPDVPHCLKNCRNALRKYDIEFEPGKFARWQDFNCLWQLESGVVLRCAPKLKADHVELPVGKNMSVSLAAQTFSRSTAAAIQGPAVVAGSAFSILQSVGATGALISLAPTAAIAGGVAGGVYLLTSLF